MKQIFHTMTEDDAYEIGIYSDGKDVKICIGSKEILIEEDINLPLEQEDLEYYIGIADDYYSTNKDYHCIKIYLGFMLGGEQDGMEHEFKIFTKETDKNEIYKICKKEIENYILDHMWWDLEKIDQFDEE